YEEQSGPCSNGGGRGGQGAGPGDDGSANQGPDTAPECPATCARPDTPGAARRDHAQPLTALWHHVYAINRLREAYDGLNHAAAPGVEGPTWAAYGEHLAAHLQDVSDRLTQGGDHARPVERGYSPKPDGRQRPLGIPTLDDTSVQRAPVEVLHAIDAGA